MKKLFLLILLLTFFPGKIFSQIIDASMSGYPLVYTGWTLANSASVVDSEIQLLPAVGGLFGEVYYPTPLNVTACGQFAVDFDWQIVPSTSGTCLGDGIAFFLINPMTVLQAGVILVYHLQLQVLYLH